jgi:hypothetical protein
LNKEAVVKRKPPERPTSPKRKHNPRKMQAMLSELGESKKSAAEIQGKISELSSEERNWLNGHSFFSFS